MLFNLLGIGIGLSGHNCPGGGISDLNIVEHAEQSNPGLGVVGRGKEVGDVA